MLLRALGRGESAFTRASRSGRLSHGLVGVVGFHVLSKAFARLQGSPAQRAHHTGVGHVARLNVVPDVLLEHGAFAAL